MFNIISDQLAKLDEKILVNIREEKQKGATLARVLLYYGLVLLLAILTILFAFWLLFRGLLSHSPFDFLLALPAFLIAFFVSYQLIFYTPKTVKNITFMLGRLIVKLIKRFRH